MTRSTNLVLLEIANGLSALIKDPELAIKLDSAYKINDQMKIDLENAQKTIEAAATAKIEIAKQKAELVSVEDKIKIAKEIEQSNKKLSEDIAKKEKDIKAAQQEIKKGKSELDALGLSIENKMKELEKFADSLKEREARINDFEQKLRAAAEKSKAALSGL